MKDEHSRYLTSSVGVSIGKHIIKWPWSHTRDVFGGYMGMLFEDFKSDVLISMLGGLGQYTGFSYVF